MSNVSASTNQGEVLPRRALRSLVIFVAVAALVLAAALVTGATTVFNVVVFVLFAGLWLVLAKALLTRPDAATAVWHALRGRSMAVQLIVWVLFLPITAALWLWSRPWPTVLRATLIAAVAFVNLATFLPKG
jgi:succinate-acetate transporter protein